ncbi:hypothetical protein BUALT_Bualt05G0030700 [Buddleja alternifolia]|uniref:aspartate--tRNA ligase n=1 Tax=Buddleja alternifolia TaxID=168488 RepID=A0AAV6XP37_9LAMI|nr:hypothetical protein BUALT_Bualt05G0030700 [Buddleja alternifolia]
MEIAREEENLLACTLMVRPPASSTGASKSKASSSTTSVSITRKRRALLISEALPPVTDSATEPPQTSIEDEVEYVDPQPLIHRSRKRLRLAETIEVPDPSVKTATLEELPLELNVEDTLDTNSPTALSASRLNPETQTALTEAITSFGTVSFASTEVPPSSLAPVPFVYHSDDMATIVGLFSILVLPSSIRLSFSSLTGVSTIFMDPFILGSSPSGGLSLQSLPSPSRLPASSVHIEEIDLVPNVRVAPSLDPSSLTLATSSEFEARENHKSPTNTNSMSSEKEIPQNPNSEENVEKKLSKKDLAKLERQRKRAAAVASAAAAVNIDDPLAVNYGEIPFNNLQSKEISGKKWTDVKDLATDLKDESVLIRGRAQTIRAVGKKMAFVVVRKEGFTVQCVLTVAQDVVSPQMVKFATSLSRESIIDIEGVVSVPAQSITGATQQVEIQVRKLYCVNRADPLPFTIEDASRSEVEIEKALQAGEQLARVHQDTRLNFRYIDTRTPANQGIFSIRYQIKHILDVEMEIKEHYSEVMDIIDRLFVAIFDHLNENCSKELEVIKRQYPFENLKYLPKTLRLTFEEGVQMLKEAGVEINPLGDLNTESERKLGQLVLEKYNTEFYILHRYPLAVRPFYTMPCYDDPNYSNSFDVFIRGEEIISGAQRIHVHWYLEERALECGIDVETISTYIDSFRYGTPPHGGFGAGLERVVMLFCALDNIRKASLFPRDPRRLEP